ncbi:hypothetical protein G039_0330960 [Pseudomonas aeruginosa VRFPA01]|nr:hypothetical protein G039_0330960 [Pseudomonas aeruginosa VRFPA01]
MVCTYFWWTPFQATFWRVSCLDSAVHSPRLNKGEARNALARAVFFNRLGEIRDRSFEQQRYRASGLNLVTAAVVLWNTVYLERAAHALRGNGHAVDDALLQYLSPLGWEHINLTGDYLWRSSAKIGAGKFRPLRPLQPA